MIRSTLVTLLLGLSVSLSLVGCQNEGAQLTGPENETSSHPQFVMMPQGLALNKEISATANVTVKTGGKLKVNYYEGNSFYLDFSLTWDPEAVSNDFTASMTTDVTYLMSTVDLTFGPHETYFLKPALLTIDVKGLDLSWIPKGTKALYLYYDNAGKWQKMPGTVVFDRSKGTLSCKDGQLPHFSRYAFGT
jgi:hypothetical protein